MPIPPQSFLLDPSTEGTLQTRIQQMVARGILSGRFRPGEKLPSSRGLASHLGVSRITVTLAYTELVADDYLTARDRSGYYVSENAPEPATFPARKPGLPTVDWTGRLDGAPGTGLGLEKPRDWSGYRYNFLYGQADPELFDGASWRLCALQALGRRDFDAMTSDQYDRDDEALVDFLIRQALPRRGILAAPDEVLITMGAQNALWLAVQVLLRPGGTAAMEDPGYPALRSILRGAGAEILPVPVDAEGLDPDQIPDRAALVFTTPSHQCPTAVTLPLERRERLLDRAERADWLVIEDDYDFETSFAAAPSPALKSLDRTGRVIYAGSFSKSIFPGLRLGYLVGAPEFIAAARSLRAVSLRHPPGHLQRTTAYFLNRGHYDAQVKRTVRALHARRRAIDAAIRRHGLTPAGPGSYGGSSLWMEAPCDTDALADRLRPRGVLIEPGAPFFAADPAPRRHYRLAYSSIPEGRIDDGIRLVAEALAGSSRPQGHRTE